MTRSRISQTLPAAPSLAHLFAARFLLEHPQRSRILSRQRRDDEIVAEILLCDEVGVEALGTADVIKRLRQRESKLRGELNAGSKRLYFPQLHGLARDLGLGDAELRILSLAVLVQGDRGLHAVARSIPVRSRSELAQLIARVIDAPIYETREALKPSARLFDTGLLAPNLICSPQHDLDDFLRPADGLSIDSVSTLDDDSKALALFCEPAQSAKLTLEDFDHYRREVQMIKDLFVGAAAQHACGVNVMLYGPPGTGKTELARAIVAAAQLRGVETAYSGKDGDPLDPAARAANFRLSQRLLSVEGQGLIIFDETEELLESDDSPYDSRGRNASIKAWKNRLLEDNPIPAIWTANVLDRVDPALLRRFSFCLRVDIPPRRKRRAILQQRFESERFDARLLEKIADDERLTPADVARSRKVWDMLPTSDDDDRSDRLAMILSGRPDGVRIQRSPRNGVPELPYEPAWINATPAVTDLAPRLKRLGFGRLGLFGPPGTGKTAFAKYLAKELGVRCEVKRASDLLDPYVGGTEQRLAAAFTEARKENAMLLIDEVDSFLSDRTGATRSWEVSQVNELLTQIDGFDGYLVICSNFTERLDSAINRRIDIKVNFSAMTSACVQQALVAAAVSLGDTHAEAKRVIQAEADLLHAKLTLGDIACAMRQSQMRFDITGAASLIECVRAEVEYRQRQGARGIGFHNSSC